MAEIPARHRRRGPHGEALGQRDAGLVGGIEQAEQRRLLGMVRAGRIARRWTDATVCLGDQLVVRQSLVGGIAPELLAHALVHMLGEGRSEEHTSELQSLMRISYAVFCLKKKQNRTKTTPRIT